MPDLSRIPLTALSNETKHLTFALFNLPKVTPSNKLQSRDCKDKEQPPAVAAGLDSRNNMIANLEREADILTLDDQIRIERGECKQQYDAFLLYADEDIHFVNDVIENLENKYNLKLCLKDRDLIPGMTFEHEAVMRLISERCNKIIPIISSHFLNSSACKFFLFYAQANSIEKKERKIIPCIYETCDFPPQLTYYCKIYFNKASADMFWDRLARSLQVLPYEMKNVPKKQRNNICQNSAENNTQEESSTRISNSLKLLKSCFPFSLRKRKSRQ